MTLPSTIRLDHPAAPAPYDTMIAAAVGELLHNDPLRMVSAEAARIALERLTYRVRQEAERQAIANLRTTEETAAELGLSVSRVRQLAPRLAVGWNTGRDWLFRPDDIERLREYMASVKPRRARLGQPAPDA